MSKFVYVLHPEQHKSLLSQGVDLVSIGAAVLSQSPEVEPAAQHSVQPTCGTCGKTGTFGVNGVRYCANCGAEATRK